MSTKSVPLNQKLSWYQETLKNNCIGNGGDGQEYDREELIQVYYKKCNAVDAKHHAKRLKEKQLEEDLKILDSLDIPPIPLTLKRCMMDLMFDETNRELYHE